MVVGGRDSRHREWDREVRLFEKLLASINLVVVENSLHKVLLLNVERKCGTTSLAIEQEYTLMRASTIGIEGTVPIGFNKDGSEPAAQGPYYCGAGRSVQQGRVGAGSPRAVLLRSE